MNQNNKEQLEWKVNTNGMIEEISLNPQCDMLKRPLEIFQSILAQVAQRATELNDEKLNKLMIRLGLYSISDPKDPEFNPDLCNKYLGYETKPEIYVKIFTKEDNNILVFEGINQKTDDCYFPHDSVFGSGITGAEHISITEDAKKLFRKIIETAEKTGDDLTCLDLMKLRDGRIHLSWIGEAHHEIDIRTLKEEEFWIGTGEGGPELYLLDKLTE